MVQNSVNGFEATNILTRRPRPLQLEAFMNFSTSEEDVQNLLNFIIDTTRAVVP